MKAFVTLFFVACMVSTGLAQSDADKKKALDLARSAIKKMDNGAIEESIALLKQAKKLDPTNYLYDYEIGYAYTISKNYKAAIKSLKAVLKYDGINDRCYTMLGNAYDMNGQPKKAIAVYIQGLEEFPNSGPLHYERGNVEEVLEQYDEALATWEKGISVQPEYPSNYYRAANYFNKYTSEKIWGVIYGELFMNIERGSSKTEKMSKLLYDTYVKAIEFSSDSSASVSFTKSMQMTLPTAGKKMVLPFGMMYEMNMLVGVTGTLLTEQKINIQTLTSIRKTFIKNWYDGKNNENYPNILFDWHKQLIDKEYFEAYNYWLFMKGNEEEFDTWYEANKEKCDEFLKWFSENPMPIDGKHFFSRMQY